MSLTRRFLNLARANLNALLDRVADSDGDGSLLEELSDEELEAELLRRKARREREAELERLRAAAESAARDRGASGAQGRAGVGPGSGAGAGASSEQRARGAGQAAGAAGASGTRGAGASSGARAGSQERLAQYYAQLELPAGADFAEVKAAYRRLMRKYHPDRYANDPAKAAVATELTQKLAQAYREIEKAVRPRRPSPKRM